MIQKNNFYLFYFRILKLRQQVTSLSSKEFQEIAFQSTLSFGRGHNFLFCSQLNTFEGLEGNHHSAEDLSDGVAMAEVLMQM